jgi:hypothetical protein
MSKIKSFIEVRFTFEGFHHWPAARDAHAYLAGAHRHLFHVRARRQVSSHDRLIEFIEFRRKLLDYCTRTFQSLDPASPVPFSCEHMAFKLMVDMELDEAEVSEDGENGAVAVKEE